MAQILRQSTAITVNIGPFIDQADGKTVLNSGVTVAVADQAAILKSDGAARVDMDSSHNLSLISGAAGWYNIDLSAADTNTVGTLELIIQDVSLYLPVFTKFQVMDAFSYDTMYAATPTILTSLDIGQLYEAPISAVTSQTEFIMGSAITSNDAWNGQIVIITNITTGEAVSRWITDVIASTNTILINSAPPFTVIVNDVLRVESRQHSTYALQTYDAPTKTELTTAETNIKNKVIGFGRVLGRKDGAIPIDDSTEVAEMNANTGSGAGSYSNTTDSLEATDVASIWTTILTESYASLGAQGTAAQMLYTMQQFLTDADVSGTTMTIRKRNGTTAAYIITLDNATTPTDKNRTT